MKSKEIVGIPYFGENTQEIEEMIHSKQISCTKYYQSLWDLIQSEKLDNKIVIINDEQGEWLTYLRDIKFNYRDKVVFIPYYQYKIFEIEYAKNYKKYKGHILFRDDTALIRYDYKLCKNEINLNNNTILLYDFNTDLKYNVTFENYFEYAEFDIDYLYKLYLNSICDYEDYR